MCFPLVCFSQKPIGVLTHDSILVGHYLDSSRFYDTSERRIIDSSLYYLNKAQKLSESLNNAKLLYEVNRQYVRLFMNARNYSIALERSFEMLDLLDSKRLSDDNIELSNYYITLLTSIGIIYFQLDLDVSLYYLEKAEKIALENHNSIENAGFTLGVIYNDIGSVYLSKHELETAQEYYEKGLYCLQKEDKNESYQSTGAIYNNLGIIHMEKGMYNQAFEYYNKSLKIRKEQNDKDGLAQVYNNKGKYYYIHGEYNNAIEMLNKSVILCRETNNYRSEMIALRALSIIYNEKRDYRQEAIVNKRESEVKDSLLIQENRGRIIQLEMQYEYEKQRQQDELEQQIELAKKEKKVLIFIIITSVLFLLILLLILLYRNLQIKSKKDKLQAETLSLISKNLELEKRNLLLQNSHLEEEVNNKNKELTTHVMYLGQKNEFIASVTEKLSELVNDNSVKINKQKINSIIKQMKSNVDKTTWEDFEIRFQQIHQDFYIKLNEKVPNLTPNEKRLSSFLYLNMTTKEISSITSQSIKSIEVARARLRKKMDIDRDENLIAVLQSL